MDQAGETGQTLFLAAAGRKMSQPAQMEFATSAPCKLPALSAPLRDLPQLTGTHSSRGCRGETASHTSETVKTRAVKHNYCHFVLVPLHSLLY